jgi:hypothetical protein
MDVESGECSSDVDSIYMALDAIVPLFTAPLMPGLYQASGSHIFHSCLPAFISF